MKLTRIQKEQLVKEMTDGLENAKTVILVNYLGLKVNEIRELKKRLRVEGIGFQIIKNTLFKIALKNKGIFIENNLLDQPIALAWGLTDEVTPPKIIVTFQKEAEKLQIIGGIYNNLYIDENMIKQLAALPGRDELYVRLVGTLNAPMYRLVNALQGNLKSLVYILKQYQESKIEN